jgi:hypothetical protein
VLNPLSQLTPPLEAGIELEQEWTRVNDLPANIVESSTNTSTINHQLLLDYDAAMTYLGTQDLSRFQNEIVTFEKSSKSSGLMSLFQSSSSSSKKLTFPDADSQLRFPFLVAQLDYDPQCAEHLAMLKQVFASFIPTSVVSATSLQGIDAHWEKLGFQGKDPRTDLNRSMKLLSVLQVIFS